MRCIAALALVALLAACAPPARNILGDQSDAGAAEPDAIASAPPQRDTSALRSAVEGAIGSFDGHASIWVSDPARPGPLFAANADEQVLSASLYKLGILVRAETLIDQGKLRPADALEGTDLTVEDALEAMIVSSDNDAALALWSKFGPASVNATLRKERIPGLLLAEDDGDNVATARGVGTLFTRLALRRLVSPAASDRMIARLSRVENRDRLPAKLPDGTRVAHKTGDLDAVVHDAGIVFTPAGPRVIVVLTWDAGVDQANELIARVARTVYDDATR